MERNGYPPFQPLARSSDLGLELANTVRGSDHSPTDVLDSPGALGRWVELVGLGEAEEGVLLRLPEFRALRAAVRDLMAAAGAGEELPRAAVEAVNRASAAVPSFPRLDAGDPRAPRIVEQTFAASPTMRMLAVVARSAIESIAHDRERIRRCPAPRCGRFFVAGRPRQVWCSAACGNRARVARHHAARRRARVPSASYDHGSAPA